MNMKVNSKSWHCRLYTFTQPDYRKYWREVSFCRYWGKIVFGICISPFIASGWLLSLPVIGVAFVVEKIFKGRNFCPFGKVERQ